MDKKKLHKVKAALHRYANEAHNTLGPEKKREPYMALFIQQLQKHEHEFEKDKLIDVPPGDLKKKKKQEEPKEEEKKKKKTKKDEEEPEEEEKKKKKTKKDEEDLLDSTKSKARKAEDLLDSSKSKSKKGAGSKKKDEITEDVKGKVDKTKKKTTDKTADKKKSKSVENKENIDIDLGELIPDITVTDSDLKCVVDILAKKHMEKKDKLYAEKYEKYLKSPAFIINFGKKTGPVVKY